MPTQRQATSQFQVGLRRMINAVHALPQQVVAKVAFELFVGIVLKTPVDTGRARASWRIGIGQAEPSVEPLRLDNRAEVEAVGVPGAASNKAFSELQKLNSPQSLAVNAGSPVYITNGLDYVRFLEEGSSKQAPFGMVAITIAEVNAGIRHEIGDV